MDILKHPSANRVLGAPASWDQSASQCDALPVTDVVLEGQPYMVSAWRPDFDELRLLNEGGFIALYVHGTNGNAHPVVAMAVEPRFLEPEPCEGPRDPQIL